MKIVWALGGIILAAAVLVAAPFAVQAQTPPVTTTEAPRCILAKPRLELRIAATTTVKDNQVKVYDSVVQRLEKLVTSSQENTYPGAGEVQTAKDTVSAALGEYKTALTTYETSLAAAKDTACAELEVAFLTSLATARANIASVRVAQDTLQGTIKQSAVPALQKYAEWLKENAPMQTSEESQE